MRSKVRRSLAEADEGGNPSLSAIFDSITLRLYNTLMQEEPSGNAVITPGDKQQETSWKFQAEETGSQQPDTNTKPGPSAKAIQWTASEFIAHAKSGAWYLMLGLGAVAFAALVFLLTRDIISVVIILIMAAVFGVFAARKPRELPYIVDDKGVQIGAKTYQYKEFRSFAIVQEGGIESIWLMPLRRFAPILGVYFEPKDGEKIVDVLAQFLPIENHKLDPIDKLMHKLRF